MPNKEFIESLDKILEKYKTLQDKFQQQLPTQEFIQVSKDLAQLEFVVEKINIYKYSQRELEDLHALMQEADGDKGMQEMIQDDINKLEQKIPEQEEEIQIALLPKDEDDSKNVILEVRAGTGGQEAALFAADLLRMYQRYAESKRWKFEILDIEDTGIGGCKEARALIKGNNVFASLKFEAGVHRVQRVPETESSGRIHTSAATIAVLPEVQELDLKIDEKDLKIETCRSSGAGGQHVNTTDSAVKIIHIPTGITVMQQSERSQHHNKTKAMQVLRSRIYEMEKRKRDQERSSDRKKQIGSGDRSEKNRTYNVPQNRVTEHRINLTLHNLDGILYRGELDEIISKLISYDQAQKLTEIS